MHMDCGIVGPPYCFLVTSMGQGYIGGRWDVIFITYPLVNFLTVTHNPLSVTFLILSYFYELVYLNKIFAVLLLCMLECEKGHSFTSLLEELNKLCLASNTACQPTTM